MRLKIDIEKSIEKRRLIPTSWYFKILDYFNYSIFATVFILCIIGPTIGVAIKIDSTDIIWISLVLVILFLVVFTLIKMDKLTVIGCHNLILDRNLIFLLAKENKWSLINEVDNLFIFNATQWYSHERQVTIILKDNLIFINIMSFGKYDIKSPIYIRKDRTILSQIIEKIKKMDENGETIKFKAMCD